MGAVDLDTKHSLSQVWRPRVHHRRSMGRGLMTLTQVGVAMATFAALGAAIKAGPPVWSFIRTVARIPRMIESIWGEFGRNGGSTTRDKIEQLIRHTEAVAVDLKAVNASTARLDATFVANSALNATTFSMLDRRLTHIETAVQQGTVQEAKHASQRKEEYEQTNG